MDLLAASWTACIALRRSQKDSVTTMPTPNLQFCGHESMYSRHEPGIHAIGGTRYSVHLPASLVLVSPTVFYTRGWPGLHPSGCSLDRCDSTCWSRFCLLRASSDSFTGNTPLGLYRSRILDRYMHRDRILVETWVVWYPHFTEASWSVARSSWDSVDAVYGIYIGELCQPICSLLLSCRSVWKHIFVAASNAILIKLDMASSIRVLLLVTFSQHRTWGSGLWDTRNSHQGISTSFNVFYSYRFPCIYDCSCKLVLRPAMITQVVCSLFLDDSNNPSMASPDLSVQRGRSWHRLWSILRTRWWMTSKACTFAYWPRPPHPNSKSKS